MHVKSTNGKYYCIYPVCCHINVSFITVINQDIETLQTIQTIQTMQTIQTIQTMQTIQTIQTIQTMQTIQTIQTIQTRQTIQTIQTIQLLASPLYVRFMFLPMNICRVGPVRFCFIDYTCFALKYWRIAHCQFMIVLVL